MSHLIDINMILTLLSVILCVRLSVCEKGDLGYSLTIGNAIDVFANYGDLSQVTQVISADYEDYGLEQVEPFREKNIRVFKNFTFMEHSGDNMVDMNILLCGTFDELLNTYFLNFNIEGTDKPWKAFLGDWIDNEILRTFGLVPSGASDNCCYVLVKLAKTERSVQLGELDSVAVKDYVQRAIDSLNVRNVSEVRKFMKSYGTHYIDSYMTGNFVYQVFKYKRSGYNLLKSYLRRSRRHPNSDIVRYYFSSFFLREVGDIRIASGNKQIEAWARKNLRDSQYLFSRPSLLRLHYNPNLAYKLNEILDTGALLGLHLKTLRPLFKDPYTAERFVEIVENDMKLWEVNA